MDASHPISIESVKTTIRAHRSHGTFLEGAQFIRSLAQPISSVTSVAIEIAQLYLVQGQYILAAQACEHVSMVPGGEDAVVMGLLQAFVGIGRYSKLKTALRMAQRIGDAWKIEGTGVSDLPLTESRVSTFPRHPRCPGLTSCHRCSWCSTIGRSW